MNQTNHFAERLSTARRMAGLSLQALADKMPNRISRQALHQFEQGTSKPEADTLLALAQTLNVSLDFFYKDSTITFEKLEYRKKVKLSKTEEVAIQEKAKDHFSRYFELEALLNAKPNFTNPIENFEVHTLDDIETAALKLRQGWDLGLKPIANVLEMLEQRGVKVLEINASDSFQGFFAEANGEKVIVLRAEDDPFRKRFTALHELGHSLLKFDDTLNHRDKETFCHAFAGAVLFPKKNVFDVFSTKRSKISFAELIQQKSYYGMSAQAILARLRHLNIITEATYKGFQIWLNKTGYRTKEPGQYLGEEKALRFLQLLYRAAIEELVSLSKAASLGNMSLSEIRKTLTASNIETK